MGPPSSSEGEHGHGVDTLEASEQDCRYVLGECGRNRELLERTSGGRVAIDVAGQLLTFIGTERQRRHALRYAKVLMQQRVGSVVVPADDIDVWLNDGLTVVPVPAEVVDAFAGSGGRRLRAMEEQHHVMMTFAVVQGEEPNEEYQELFIFGSRPCRRSAQLNAMAAIEDMMKGYFTRAFHESGETFATASDLTGDWGTSTMALNESEMSEFCSNGGVHSKRVAAASGCIVGPVGDVVFMSGPKPQRRLAQEYVELVLDQLKGPVLFEGKGREDCITMDMPAQCLDYLNGASRLAKIEDASKTILLFSDEGDKKMATLSILGSQERSRREAHLAVLGSLAHFEKQNNSADIDWKHAEDVESCESSSDGLAVDKLALAPENVARVVGKDSCVRLRIQNASGASYQVIRNVAFILGDRAQRQRCRDYIGWLLGKDQRPFVVDVEGRNDATELDLPEGFYTVKASTVDLREVETSTHTLCLMAGRPNGKPRLLILGHEEGTTYSSIGRARAEDLVKTALAKPQQTHEKAQSRQSEKDSWSTSGGSWTAERRESWNDPSEPSRSRRDEWHSRAGDDWKPRRDRSRTPLGRNLAGRNATRDETGTGGSSARESKSETWTKGGRGGDARDERWTGNKRSDGRDDRWKEGVWDGGTQKDARAGGGRNWSDGKDDGDRHRDKEKASKRIPPAPPPPVPPPPPAPLIRRQAVLRKSVPPWRLDD